MILAPLAQLSHSLSSSKYKLLSSLVLRIRWIQGKSDKLGQAQKKAMTDHCESHDDQDTKDHWDSSLSAGNYEGLLLTFKAPSGCLS